jgi:DNA-binding GntR family transcriptional regulator
VLQIDIMPSRVIKRRPQTKSTKAESVYQELRRLILNSELPAGAVVSERMLAEQLLVGKAPVRVAIQRLAAEGFLTIEPRRGIRITEQSVQDVLDLFQVRILMEQLVVRQIAGKLSLVQIARLRENLHELRAASQVPDIDQMIMTDFAFHRMLAEFHGNKQMILMLDRTFDSLYREIRSSMKVRSRAEERFGEHEQIVSALVSGDAEAADRSLVRHLQSGQRFVMSRGKTSLFSEG